MPDDQVENLLSRNSFGIDFDDAMFDLIGYFFCQNSGVSPIDAFAGNYSVIDAGIKFGMVVIFSYS